MFYASFSIPSFVSKSFIASGWVLTDLTWQSLDHGHTLQPEANKKTWRIPKRSLLKAQAISLGKACLFGAFQLRGADSELDFGMRCERGCGVSEAPSPHEAEDMSTGHSRIFRLRTCSWRIPSFERAIDLTYRAGAFCDRKFRLQTQSHGAVCGAFVAQ